MDNQPSRYPEKELLAIAFGPPQDLSLCDMCPTRATPFLKRTLTRATLIHVTTAYASLSKVKTRSIVAFLSVLSFLLSLLIASLLESIYCCLPNTLPSMKTFISLAACAALISVPSYILIHDSTQYNVTCQVLFSILLFGASIWFSYELNNAKAKKEASSKWLPAAEGAAKQLMTMSHTVDRMRTRQSSACGKIKPLITPERTTDCKALEHFFGIQCEESAENLSTIKNQLDEAASQWDMFINENCEFGECLRINQRIEQLRNKLALDAGTIAVPATCSETTQPTGAPAGNVTPA
jgi:hypothetical protein